MKHGITIVILALLLSGCQPGPYAHRPMHPATSSTLIGSGAAIYNNATNPPQRPVTIQQTLPGFWSVY